MEHREAAGTRVSKADLVVTLFGLLMLGLVFGLWAHLWVR